MEGFELAFKGPLDLFSRKELRTFLSKVSMFKIVIEKNDDDSSFCCRKQKNNNNEYICIKPFWIKAGTSKERIDWSLIDNSSGRKKFWLETTKATVEICKLLVKINFNVDLILIPDFVKSWIQDGSNNGMDISRSQRWKITQPE